MTANTKAAEVLYKKIGDICELDEKTVLLDICCGTGTIGLVLASVAIIISQLCIYSFFIVLKQFWIF